MSEKKERTYLIDDPQFSVLSKKGFFGNIPHSKQLGMFWKETEPYFEFPLQKAWWVISPTGSSMVVLFCL